MTGVLLGGLAVTAGARLAVAAARVTKRKGRTRSTPPDAARVEAQFAELLLDDTATLPTSAPDRRQARRRGPARLALRIALHAASALSPVGWRVPWCRREAHRAIPMARVVHGAWRGSPPRRTLRPPAEVLAGARAAGALAAAAMTGALTAAAGPPGAALACAPAALLLMGPDLILEASERRFRRRVHRQLAAGLDLLAAALAAGSPLPRALAFCAAHSRPEMAWVLRRVRARVQLGEPPALAFEAEAARHGVGQLSLVALLVRRGEELGLEPAPSLRRVADEARRAARVAESQRAARLRPLCALITAVIVAPPCMAVIALLVVGGALTHAHGVW